MTTITNQKSTRGRSYSGATHMACGFAALLLSSGCLAGSVNAPFGSDPQGLDDTNLVNLPGDDTGIDGSAAALFTASVEGLLRAKCASCHTGSGGVDFMSEDAMRDQIMAFSGLVVPGDPSRSTLLTKGAHAGPAWSAEETSTISDWIRAEGAPAPGEGASSSNATVNARIWTTPVRVTTETTRLSLDSIGITGGTVTIESTRTADALAISSVSFNMDRVGGRFSGLVLAVSDEAGNDIGVIELTSDQAVIRQSQALNFEGEYVVSLAGSAGDIFLNFGTAELATLTF